MMKGYSTIGITDHVDFTNIEFVISMISKVKPLSDILGIDILVGVELTHVPPEKMEPLANLARRLGAELVVVHGETPVEPVYPGTNRKAVEIGVDILAHPGFITAEDADLAKDNSVCLEITSRSGHNITNGHVVRVGREAGASLVVNTDTHRPEDLIDIERAKQIAMGAGLREEEARRVVSKSPIVKD
jgi:histidinol phosphatase-like PHP family hydrolase